MTNASGILRITRDIKDVQTGGDLSIAVAYKDSDLTSVRGFIIGPPDTPYEFGFFEFGFSFEKDYPTNAPVVTAITTNSGYTRFNPNIYADGKVCLSILGTWRGSRGELWSSAQGLSSILWSIQSLMSSDPFSNEPGFEGKRREDKDKKEAIEYRQKIHHETLRISVIHRLEDYLGIPSTDKFNPALKSGKKKPLEFGADESKEEEESTEPWNPFMELCKRRFLWYYDSYKRSIAEAKEEKDGVSVLKGRKFPTTPFEYETNMMRGAYDYEALEKRLDKIQGALEEECRSWRAHGREHAERENPRALAFFNTFRKIQDKFQNGDTPMELSLEDKKNPFVWEITLFGKNGTKLEGAILNIQLVFHKDFPETWPRVICQTPLFHHRISQRGTICYIPEQADEIESHIEAIINALEEETPRHDPRMRVNPEASALLWGTPEQQKVYYRKLRRSAQDSAENC